MRRIPVAAILGAVLAVAAGAWWMLNFERVPETEHVGLAGEARRDPYLALKRLLARSGMRVTDTAATAAPGEVIAALPRGGTLILRARREVLMTPARVQTLLSWVERGGHLIVEAEPPRRADPLLATVGIRSDFVNVPGAAAQKGPARRGLRPVPYAVRLPEAPHELRVEFGSPTVLREMRRSAEWKVEDERGTAMLSFRHGSGRVTALNGFAWMTFRGRGEAHDEALQAANIGQYDHAEAIVRLIRQNPSPAGMQVRIMGGHSSLSLAAWLAEYAWMALASLAVLVALWLLRVTARFGPLLPSPAAAELRIGSHLRASGRFYARHLPLAQIHAALRHAFLQRLAERRPGIAARAPEERNRLLATLGDVRADALARALDQGAQNAAEFTRSAALLQRLGQKL